LTPIDAVITWVDGNDPEHLAKRSQFLDPQQTLLADINGDTRFNSVGEIFYCLASILTFAPFFRKIFIVTDQQNPMIDEFLKTHFPAHPTVIEIIDHQEIFEGYEDFLPVFNSIAIETMLFKIKDLSEQFVYFNDDFFIIKEVTPTDFFYQDSPVSSGSYRLTGLDQFLSWIKPLVQGRKKFGYKDSLINAFKFLPYSNTYWYLNHAPTPLLRSVLQHFYEKQPQALIHNISHKFRNHQQFNPQSLFYQSLISQEKNFYPSKKSTLFLRPNRKSKYHLQKKLKELDKDSNLSFCCAESLDQYPRELRTLFYEKLESVLSLPPLIS
jgi:hypothetical protein